MVTRWMVPGLIGLAMLSFAGGCSNKTSAERESLLKQNKSLEDQLNAEKARADAAEARANAAGTAAATPAPEAAPTAPGMEEPAPEATATPARGSTSLGTGISRTKNKYGQNVIEISGDVLFDSGKATLKPAAKKSLDKVAAAIKKEYPGQMLRIEGHTDPNPVKHSAWDDNWDLGHARARAVLLYLASRGIPEKNMYSASFAANGLRSTKNYALDRRVDIVVVNSGR